MFRFENFFDFGPEYNNIGCCKLTMRFSKFCCCLSLDRCFNLIAFLAVIETFASLVTRQLFNAVLQILLVLILANAWKNSLMVSCEG